MLELILTVCLLADTTRCKDVTLTMVETHQVTPQQCFHNGQIEMVKWLEANPKWRIAKWKCQVPRNKIDI
jgi:hypothetical protein